MRLSFRVGFQPYSNGMGATFGDVAIALRLVVGRSWEQEKRMPFSLLAKYIALPLCLLVCQLLMLRLVAPRRRPCILTLSTVLQEAVSRRPQPVLGIELAVSAIAMDVFMLWDLPAIQAANPCLATYLHKIIAAYVALHLLLLLVVLSLVTSRVMLAESRDCSETLRELFRYATYKELLKNTPRAYQRSKLGQTIRARDEEVTTSKVRDLLESLEKPKLVWRGLVLAIGAAPPLMVIVLLA